MLRANLPWLLLIWLGTATLAAAQPARYDILSNGASSNRINIVLLAEGYTTNQLASFLAHATNAVKNLLSFQPWLEYSNYFNAVAITVASTQSGSDHPSFGQFRDTWFNSTFDPDLEQILTIPPNYTNTNYAEGRGRIDALLQSLVPDYNTNRDFTILLVNDLVFGGSGGPLTIVSRNVSQPELLAHESAHTVAKLGDEYSQGILDGDAIGEEPNTTMETNRALIKWNAWIDPATPVPTPAASEHASAVGLFEGAHYQPSGWYRPKLDCMMRSLGAPFCEVCQEALVLSFYARVRPIESATPVSTNLMINTTGLVSFAVTTLQPLAHSLNIEWFTNGVPFFGATGTVFELPTETLGSGTNTVGVRVTDPTAWVRSDPTQRLMESRSWTLVVNPAELRLDSPRLLADGAFTFRVTGTASQNVVVEGSTNLTQWTALETNALVSGESHYTNSDALRFRYFRAVAPP